MFGAQFSWLHLRYRQTGRRQRASEHANLCEVSNMMRRKSPVSLKANGKLRTPAPMAMFPRLNTVCHAVALPSAPCPFSGIVIARRVQSNWILGLCSFCRDSYKQCWEHPRRCGFHPTHNDSRTNNRRTSTNARIHSQKSTIINIGGESVCIWSNRAISLSASQSTELAHQSLECRTIDTDKSIAVPSSHRSAKQHMCFRCNMQARGFCTQTLSETKHFVAFVPYSHHSNRMRPQAIQTSKMDQGARNTLS
jgi:hypothetical protein